MGVDPATKDFADEFFENYKRVYTFRVEDSEGAKFKEINTICTGGQTGCGHTFDLTVGRQNAIKFDTGTLHIRSYPHPQQGFIRFHWDIYNIRTDFFRHVWVDSIGNFLHGGGL